MKDFRARELQTTSTAKLGMGGLATGGGGGGVVFDIVSSRRYCHALSLVFTGALLIP